MAVTQPDLNISPYEYMDVYLMQKVVTGTRCIMQNKSNIPMYVQVNLPTVKPPATSRRGSYVQPYEYLELRPDAGETIWVMSVGSFGKVSLQVKAQA